ncbi:MAG: DUF1492 domain-containing protein [Lachnospiraceae bacterium]|nr:DUF1492 domain-containing protein [Lachnospiraceae bacterium]
MEEHQNPEDWVDAKSIKTRLLQYREKERDIDNQIERLDALAAKLYGVGSPQITDMPKGSSPSGDRTLSQIARKQKLEEQVKEMINEQADEQKWIESVLGRLSIADEKAVIRMRYIDGEKWDNVSELLFGSKDDYEEKRDSYLRRVTKLHGRALINMARIIEQEK